MRSRPVLVGAALVGTGLGLGLSSLWAAGEGRLGLPRMAELEPIETLAPMRAMPRTTLVLAMQQAKEHLAANRPWSAWNVLHEHLASPADAAPSAVLLAARAAEQWGAWDHVRDLLRDQDWLDRAESGEGLYLLGRAEQEAEQWDRAAAAYRGYAAVSAGRKRGVAEARLADVLRAGGDDAGAAAAFASAARDLPEAADWLLTLQAEAALAADQPERAARIPQPAGSSDAARLRRARADAAALRRTGNTAGAVERLERETRMLAGQGAWEGAAALSLDRARLLHNMGRTAEARELLRSTAWEGSVAPRTRREAAALLGEIATGGATAAEELARAAAYEAADRPGLAARSLRAALAGGAPDGAAIRLRLGRLLFDAGDLKPARLALADAAASLGDRERVAEAELYSARARYRGGDRAGGLAELRSVAERRGGTAAAGTALFLLGDASDNIDDAISLYQRAASIERSPDAREALRRVGDRSLKNKDPAAALRAWEAYVGRYPTGEATADLAYRAALTHERAGRDERARAMYTAAILADPLSYAALRAGERIGVDPLDGPLREPHPWVGLAADPADAATALRRLDLLDDAGLDAVWEPELDATIRRLDARPAALIALAEGLRDRGHPVEAIRLGRRLLERRGGEWDGRLLHVIFPLPFRDLLEAEAERAELDPMLLAGLIRQESTFRPAARSRVGASGLAQIMPSTGRWLARGVGVRDYEDRLLLVPEVNLRMGAQYLADLLDRYDGAKDLALAGYNAGPGRADRWRRELGHAQDTDRFRENIPFDETRHYVKVVLRNAAVYRRLYGPARGAGLVRPE